MDHLLYDPNDGCHTRGSITPEETRREETDERENERLRTYETLFFQINYVVLLVLILNDSTSLISAGTKFEIWKIVEDVGKGRAENREANGLSD